METRVSVQVHVLKPRWVNGEENRYRLYVNNALITERDWIWGLGNCIEENLWINIDPAVLTKIRLDPILNPPDSVIQFTLRNLKVNDIDVPTEDNLELSFTI